MALQWGTEPQCSRGPAKQLPPASLPLGMVASGSISKGQVRYANAVPLSAVLLIYVFACFLQACKTRAIICLPHPHPFVSLCQGSAASPVVASMATQRCRSAPAHVLLAMAKRRKGDLKEFRQPKPTAGELEAGALV